MNFELLNFELRKSERLHSHTLIDRLFEPGRGSKSLTAFPLRVVFRIIEQAEQTETNASILISVPKRQFKHAVDRNHVKRQVREAYRTNKELIRLPEGKALTIAFIWLDSQHHPTSIVTAKVKNLMQRITEQCATY